MQGEVLWKRYIDHIKPLTCVSSSLLPVIPSQAAQQGEPSAYPPGMADVPPVNMINPGQDTTEIAVPLSKTILTQGAVHLSSYTSTPNSEESEPMVVSSNPNIPSQSDGQARIPTVPSLASMDPPTQPKSLNK